MSDQARLRVATVPQTAIRTDSGLAKSCVLSRRQALVGLAAGLGSSLGLARWGHARKADGDGTVQRAITKGLDWVAKQQSSLGHWTANSSYAAAMTGLAGLALAGSGSTATQGPHSKNVRRAIDFLVSKSRDNGLIGDPLDGRYTYGHGFSMLFLSQVLGEEEDAERREELVEVLSKAVDFSGKAQTPAGGWGYVSAKDGGNFDEGSTTITQVQGLRGCRNAGIPVPSAIIENAKNYIYSCKNPDGGISYSSRNRGSSRPAITAAALATLYNAGDYDSEHVPAMLEYAKKNLHSISNSVQQFGHWHYTYLYYSQVVYRQDVQEWQAFRDRLYKRIVEEQLADGSWSGNVAPIYVTACNLIMLQLDNALLPIYQR